MRPFLLGDEVRVLAPSFALPTGVVIDPANGNIVLTVTVRLGDGREWYFDPTDELEHVEDGTEPERSGTH